jgi:hydrogenase-4 component F
MTRIKGTQRMSGIGGLTSSHPLLGWLFVASVAAIAGLPPFGLFASEFLVVTSAFASEPLLAVLLVLGLLVSLGALFMRLNAIAFGEPVGSEAPSHMSHAPIAIHLALVLMAGFLLPGAVTGWFRHVADLLGG